MSNSKPSVSRFRTVFALFALLALSACVHQQARLSAVSPIRMRFQNMVGLELSHAGCSILNFGGLDRLCEYAHAHSADLLFQIGPAFSQVTSSDERVDETTLQEHRLIQWREWSRQGVRFYAVSAKDLSPSLDLFNAATSSGAIRKISSNLRTRNNAFLFEPYTIADIKGAKLAFLSFSDDGRNDSKAPWIEADLEISFKEATAQLPPSISAYHVMGSLNKTSRLKLAAISDKPILFIGGVLAERNSTEVIAESPRGFWMKAPDIGRGLGEIEISPAGSASSGAAPEGTPGGAQGVTIGEYSYAYRAVLLPKTIVITPACAGLVPSTTVVGEERKACAPMSKMNKDCKDE